MADVYGCVEVEVAGVERRWIVEAVGLLPADGGIGKNALGRAGGAIAGRVLEHSAVEGILPAKIVAHARVANVIAWQPAILYGADLEGVDVGEGVGVFERGAIVNVEQPLRVAESGALEGDALGGGDAVRTPVGAIGALRGGETIQAIGIEWAGIGGIGVRGNSSIVGAGDDRLRIADEEVVAGEVPEALGDVGAAVAAAGDHLESAILDIGDGAIGEQVPPAAQQDRGIIQLRPVE